MAWQHIGAIARRLAANVIEQRRKVIETEFTVSLTAGNDNSPSDRIEDPAAAALQACPAQLPSQALAVGREADRQIGA
jgi:hypothetical protein